MKSDPAWPADNLRGALWMLGSAIAFTLSVALIKFLGPHYSPSMQVFFRQFVGFIVLLPFVLRNPRAAFATRHPWLFVARGAATSLSMILSFLSYQRLPLAEANALSFSRTLWLVPLAVVFLGERVGPARVIATLAGFGGVLVVLRPGEPGSYLTGSALAGLTAALLLAFSVTGIKALTRTHAMLPMLAWAAVLGVAFTLPPALLDWHTPSMRDGALLAVMGGFGMVSQFCYVRGLSLGDMTVMAPVDYSRIFLTAIFGLVFFGERPAASTWIGVAVIVASAVFITLHAQRRATAEGALAS